MTRILRLEIKGFKSFATKTELVFGENFNCIIGPNGSGKSNVLDALCFVLGKAGAKGLRVEKSGNLIYNGGKTKKPAKEGEVSIWFDNKDKDFSAVEEDEIKITRVIKASGQGIYKLNDKTTTRTQILDVLGMAHINPDGYNIILQGDVIRLIEMSTNERRKIIEEIAGINIYEDKKNKALRELNRVEEKLNEADIILAERQSYLKELKKDRDKAQKYKDLDEKKRRNKKTLIVTAMKVKQSQVDKLDEQISTHKTKINSLEEEIVKLRKDIVAKKEEIDMINKEVEEKGEKEQVKIHKMIEEMKVNVALNKQRLQTIETEIEKLTSRQSELEESRGELKEKISYLESKRTELGKRIKIRETDRAQIVQKIAQFKKKHNLEAENNADQRIDGIDKELEDLQLSMNALREEQQGLFRDKDKIELQLQTIDERLDKMASVKEEHKKELEQLRHKKQEFKKTTLELSKSLSDASELSAQLATARSKHISKQEELARLEGRRANILEQLAGGSALKHILELRKKEKGIYGTIAELGNVQQAFSQALEMAAGNKIKSVVVETDVVAAKCIRYLKQNKLGVATFLPLNKIKSHPINEALRKLKSPGVKGLAIDLISFKPQFKKVFEYVFGATLVVDSVDVGRKIGIGKARMVTTSGDLMEISGAMRGGFRQQRQKGGLFGQEEVANEIERLQREVADNDGVIATLEQKLTDNEGLVNRLRALKAELEGDIIRTEKSLHLDSSDALLDGGEKKKLTTQNKELEKQIDAIQSRISDKNKTFATLKIERQQLRDKVTDLRNPAKLAELKSFEEKQMELSQEIIQLEGELKHAITEMETIIGPEDRKILEIIKQHKKEMDGFVSERKTLQQQVKTQEVELAAKEKQEAKFYVQFKELFTKRSKITDSINKIELKIANNNGSQRNLEQKNNALALENARLKAELAGLQEEDKDYQGVEPYTNKASDLMKRELNQFERLAGELGAVNMRALEIYEQVEKEYYQLQEKKDVLRKERADVLLMMNEIDSKKKELFMKTFDALQENFQRIFSTLLVKGDASVVLEDQNDPFAAGVEIKVRLTGKRFLDIRSLSGGEKTMTALAFLFAVQEYEPANFYIMDEVDAALDRKNSEKLASLVRGYCEHAQYLVISHNDGVISEADNLYGISMNEHGMSKVTSLKI